MGNQEGSGSGSAIGAHGGDPVRASVAHLLSRANGVPCSAAAQAFGQLVVPSERFGIALDVLLPSLSGKGEVRPIFMLLVMRVRSVGRGRPTLN